MLNNEETGSSGQRKDVKFFEGINSQVSQTLAKTSELYHAENARSKIIGVIEKREGQVVEGKNILNQPFNTKHNYGLFSFGAKTNNWAGLFRISDLDTGGTLSINVRDSIRCIEGLSTTPGINALGDIFIFAKDTITTDDLFYASKYDNGTNYIFPVESFSDIYGLNNSKQWVLMDDPDAQNIAGGDFSNAMAEGDMYLANYNDYNRVIKSDVSTVDTSETTSGNLYNSPRSHLVNYYKSRLYLADFVRSGVRYKTTILRSSYKMGIIALVNTDVGTVLGGASGSIPVTDNRYFYSVAGANSYDIYRGGSKVITITVTNVQETSITATFSGTATLQAADEIWIAGTYTGQKVFRWVNNPTINGQDVKQYDTFKLGTNDDQEIKMLTNIGNVMMVSNNNSMASWNDYTLTNFDLNVGCVSRRGYTKLLGSLYFMHYSGVYSSSGSVPQLLSVKVERYIRGASREGLEGTVAGCKGRSIFFCIGDVNLYYADGSFEKTLKDTCLEYNATQQEWYVHTNVKAAEFETFVDTNDVDRLMFIDKGGVRSVKEFLKGNLDDGINIPFRADTSMITLGSSFEFYCNPASLSVETERGSALKSFISLDGDQYYEIFGTAFKGVSILKIDGVDTDKANPPTARKVQISFRDNSPQICKILRTSLIYIPTSETLQE